MTMTLKKSTLFLLCIITLLALSVKNTKSQQVNETVPPAQKKLLVIGDSLTNGLYASHEQATFASVLAQISGYALARRNGAKLPAAVITWGEVKVWNPDIVVLEIGLNDVSLGTVPDSEWAAMYSSLLADMKSTGAKVVACTMFWGGIESSHPNYNRYMLYNQMIRDAAKSNDVSLADLWAATDGCKECVSRSANESYFAPHYHGDNFHPSNYGHEMIAKIVFESIEKRLYVPFVGR